MHPVPTLASGAFAWILLGAAPLLVRDPPPAVHAVPVAERGEASFHVDVPARQWRALALKNLPAGTTVHASVAASAPMEVRLLPAEQLATYPSSLPPLFAGRVEDRLEFSVAVPSAGHYALVLDNRGGATESKADLRVEAAVAGAGPAGKKSTPHDPGI